MAGHLSTAKSRIQLGIFFPVSDMAHGAATARRAARGPDLRLADPACRIGAGPASRRCHTTRPMLRAKLFGAALASFRLGGSAASARHDGGADPGGPPATGGRHRAGATNRAPRRCPPGIPTGNRGNIASVTSDWYFVLMIGVLLVALLGYCWATIQAPRLSLGTAAATLLLCSLALGLWGWGSRPALEEPRANLAATPPVGWPASPLPDPPMAAAGVRTIASDEPPRPDAGEPPKPAKPKVVRAKPMPRPPAVEADFPYTVQTGRDCGSSNNRVCP